MRVVINFFFCQFPTVVNGAKRQPVLPINLNCQDPGSRDVTSLGSPRLPPRKPHPVPRRQRAASCDPAIPSYFDCTQRKYENKNELYLPLFNSILFLYDRFFFL